MPNTRDYTSLEISQRLKELGFVAETDAWWIQDLREYQVLVNESYLNQAEINKKDVIPALSAQTLLDILPAKSIKQAGGKVNNMTIIKSVSGDSHIHSGTYFTYADTLANALGKMLEELIIKGVVNV